jgi:predicted CopG family antitoxin
MVFLKIGSFNIIYRVNTMSKRHSIQVSQEVYEKLIEIGHFGESFNELIARLLTEKESTNHE